MKELKHSDAQFSFLEFTKQIKTPEKLKKSLLAIRITMTDSYLLPSPVIMYKTNSSSEID